MTDKNSLVTIFFIGLAAILTIFFFPSFLEYEFKISYRWVHFSIEIFTAIISLIASSEAFIYFKKSRQKVALFISFVFLSYSALNIVHAISFGGMPATFLFPSTNTSIMTGILAKTILAAGLIFVTWLIYLNRNGMITTAKIAGSFGLLVIFFALLLSNNSPEFINLHGSTGLKYISAIIIFCMFLSSGYLYYRFGKMRFMVYPFLNFVLLMLISEALLFHYRSTYYLTNFIGHAFKAVAFFALLLAIKEFRKNAYLPESKTSSAPLL